MAAVHLVCGLRGGRTFARATSFNYIYFYLEFHMTLNSCVTKPVNIGAQWGLIDL